MFIPWNFLNYNEHKAWRCLFTIPYESYLTNENFLDGNIQLDKHVVSERSSNWRRSFQERDHYDFSVYSRLNFLKNNKLIIIAMFQNPIFDNSQDRIDLIVIVEHEILSYSFLRTFFSFSFFLILSFSFFFLFQNEIIRNMPTLFCRIIRDIKKETRR